MRKGEKMKGQKLANIRANLKKAGQIQFRARMLGVSYKTLSVRVPQVLHETAMAKAHLEGLALKDVMVDLLLAYAGDEAKAEIANVKWRLRDKMLAAAQANLDRMRTDAPKEPHED